MRVADAVNIPVYQEPGTVWHVPDIIVVPWYQVLTTRQYLVIVNFDVLSLCPGKGFMRCTAAVSGLKKRRFGVQARTSYFFSDLDQKLFRTIEFQELVQLLLSRVSRPIFLVRANLGRKKRTVFIQ